MTAWNEAALAALLNGCGEMEAVTIRVKLGRDQELVHGELPQQRRGRYPHGCAEFFHKVISTATEPDEAGELCHAYK